MSAPTVDLTSIHRRSVHHPRSASTAAVVTVVGEHDISMVAPLGREFAASRDLVIRASAFDALDAA